MNEQALQVRMLGSFSIRWMDNAELSDNSNRMRKIWLLLAYLIYRCACVSQEELISLLWDEKKRARQPRWRAENHLFPYPLHVKRTG